MPFTKEELECLEELSKMSDDEIDLSDIPETTHEEFQRAIARKRARLNKENLNFAS